MPEPLLPYQITGSDWLAGKTQAFLADDMGLGKSAQVVRAADLVGADDILVLCPASVRVNWTREFWKWSPMDRPCFVITSGKDPIPTHGVVVCSYDLAVPLAAKLKARTWDILVLDEAHYLKERSAKRTRAAYGRGSNQPGLDKSAKRVWRLSGTPIPNFANEFYTHARSGGVATETYWDWTFRYCKGWEGDFGYQISGHKNVDELKERLTPFLLRRRKEDVLIDLPSIRFQTVAVERGRVELDPDFYDEWRPLAGGQNEFLQKMGLAESNMADMLRAAKTPADRLGVIESMAGTLSTLRKYIGACKVGPVASILEEELASGQLDKVVIFAIHHCVITGLQDRMRKFGAVTLWGGTPPEKRQKAIDSFAKDPRTRVFIGQIVAAGVGIDGLQKQCCEVAFAEMDWVPGNNAQAAMRVHRIGQTRPVRVRMFELDGSVDLQVAETLRRKVQELSKIF